MNIHRRRILRLLFLVFTIVLADYSPVLYYKMYPHTGSWPAFYNYHDRTPADLMTAIEKIRDENISIIYIPDTRKSSSRYTQVVFLDKSTKDYYHTWVSVDTVDSKKFTQIVFGYVSQSIDFRAGKKINANFDFVTNCLTKRRFEELVIQKLQADKKIISA